MSPLLSIQGATAFYGAVQALKGVDLEVGAGEIVALIGANGAGKSTLMMSIFGVPRLRSGRIVFDGRDITDLPTHEIARLSIAQSPEGRRIFARMTVFENLQMGAAVAGFSRFDEDLERVYGVFPRLKERASQRGGTLSGGEQQMLAIARALMSRPKLLLLDEPSLGLAPLICRQIFDVVRRLNKEEGLSVFLVEQDAHHALKLADRGYVMVNGAIAMQGPGAELLRDPKIRAAYLEGGRELNFDFVIGDPRVFIGVTLVLGGLASVAAGRAVALSWRPLVLLPLYGLPLAFAMRFLHWSLFGEPLAAPLPALIAYGWTLFAQGLAWGLAHRALVRRQYPWLARQGAGTQSLADRN